MKRFHSYGPVDSQHHFCVERKELVARWADDLIGDPDKGGDYLRICGPRQAGKTWLMYRIRKEVIRRHGERFRVADISFRCLITEEQNTDQAFFFHLPKLFRDGLDTDIDTIRSWDEWLDLFSVRAGILDRPLILFIDEFDSLPPRIADRLLTTFRYICLNRQNYRLHGLALIGVQGPPFNEGRDGSMLSSFRTFHMPNLTVSEVEEMFRHYQEEAGQVIEPEVVRAIHEMTGGYPGLVSWFGELLTEKFNPGAEQAISSEHWQAVCCRAGSAEWNPMVQDLIRKVKEEYLPHITSLFTRSDIPFAWTVGWCNRAWHDGIIVHRCPSDIREELSYHVCRFSSPFVHLCVYSALINELMCEPLPILPLDPLDDLSDVFDQTPLNVMGLVRRYQDYLKNLRNTGLAPWRYGFLAKYAPLAEAGGQFHLHAWLNHALGRYFAIVPRFTGKNSLMYLHIRHEDKEGIIVPGNFRDIRQIQATAHQAAECAANTDLEKIALVLFVSGADGDSLKKISRDKIIKGIHVTVTAADWG